MTMEYVSTRGNEQKLTGAAAILAGMAEDGGLFVPTEIPKVASDFPASLVDLEYPQRAARILGLFFDDYEPEELRGCLERAYRSGKFDDPAVAPTRWVGDMGMLELWHGPTSAFKDMALQLLPQLLSTALRKTGEKSEVLILAATSGDTGKAALAGFCDVPQTKIMVFYPSGGVSRMQWLQMVTQEGQNVAVMAVEGNFDDAQRGVKEIFSDGALREKFAASGVKLSSANSINWGRLAPQIVYYFSAYADLLRMGTIKSGDAVNFTVPTGNFGNILAGFYARQMGLPIGRLVCASNQNNVLTDFLLTGYYDRNREFFKTITPSMDILISSNLERLLYHLTGDTAMVRHWMKNLAEEGRYDCGVSMIQRMQNYFWADWADDAKTKAAIKEVYDAHRYVMDPHTAVAWAVAHVYQRRTDDRRPMVVVSTASPYKFNDSVLSALGIETEGRDCFALLKELVARNEASVPSGLAALQGAAVLHEGVCRREEMAEEVRRFAARK